MRTLTAERGKAEIGARLRHTLLCDKVDLEQEVREETTEEQQGEPEAIQDIIMEKEDRWAGSSSDEELERPATLERRERGLKRLKKYGRLQEADPLGSTFLERHSVTRRVWNDYCKRVERLADFLDREQVTGEDDRELDRAIVKYMTNRFLKGHECSDGEKLLAGWTTIMPEYGRLGSRHIPRTWRSLKGWRKVAPTRSRKPLPWPAVAGIACRMAMRGHYQMAVGTLVAFTAYLRPKELLGLHKADLVRPHAAIGQHWALLVCPEEREARTKVGAADDSVLLDSSVLPWLGAALEVLIEGKPGQVWDFDYAVFLRQFKLACADLQLDGTPYQLRHAGPSWDRVKNLRSQQEVQKRGRWKSLSSVTRYERHARLGFEMVKIPAAVQSYLDTCVKQLEAFVLHGRPVPPVPRT